jgi:hypothetical protein
MVGHAIIAGSVAGQAIKAEGAELEGRELSPTLVLSSTSTAEIEVDDGIETGNPHDLP